MVSFTTIIKHFGLQGEKTSWTYFEVPVDASDELMPENIYLNFSFQRSGMPL